MEAIEQTIAIMMRNRVNLTNLDDVTMETLSVIEEIINDETMGEGVMEMLATRFRGMIVVKVYSNGDIRTTCAMDECIYPEDKKRITDWLKTNEHDSYTDDYFRLDLVRYILLFKAYRLNNSKVLIGHLLENNFMVKVELLQARQRYLMREFL